MAAFGNAGLGGVVLSGSSKVTRLNTHDMAKKIEVWAHLHSHRGEWFVDERPHETKVAGTQKASTLVVHGEKHERVFTESEVRAIMEHMLDDKWFMHGTAEAREEKIRHMAKTHGIVLDPA